MMPSSLKPSHAAAAIALHQTHLDSVSALNYKAMEEGQKHQTFVRKLSATLQTCPSKDCWALLYPLQLLAGWGSLSPLLGMPAAAQLQAMTDAGSVPVPPTLSVLGTPVPQPGGKWWHHSSDQGMPDLGKERRLPVTCPMSPP